MIAKPDERWTERPLRLRRAARGSECEARRSCATFLAAASRSGGCPDEFAFIDEVPKTSVGKFDKKVLRKQLAEDSLPGRTLIEAG